MARAFLREITRADTKQALKDAMLVAESAAAGLEWDTIAIMAAILLTRPEKAVYVDVDYKIVTKPIVEGV